MAQNKQLREQIFQLIHKERARQESLHPMQECNDFYFHAVLTEEVGEVAKALQEGTNLDEELIQVASVCFRWLENRQTKLEIQE
jgi:NTP pyrophosphatase (non-canonical NTP hydrolase)